MNWTRSYGLALRLLPSGLRRKHGNAMENLFRRDLNAAAARGRSYAARTGALAIWDVLRRAAYEHSRVRRLGSAARREAVRGMHPDSREQATAINSFHTAMQPPETRELVRRLATSFAVSLALLTTLLLLNFAIGRVPPMLERGASPMAIREMLLLAVPFTTALTLPMATLIAVLWQFTRPGATEILAATRMRAGGVGRLVTPVLLASLVVSAAALALNAEVVPRANARLQTVLAGNPVPTSDRSMTIGELREAADTVREGSSPAGIARAAAYEVELHKKLALPLACLVLAAVGLAIAFRLPRRGRMLALVATAAVFIGYYLMLVAGETLADRMLVSPAVGMWSANALMLVLALLLARWRPLPAALAS